MILKTPRLILRDINENDFNNIHAYVSDNEVTKYLYSEPNNIEDTHSYILSSINSSRMSPRTRYELALTTYNFPDMVIGSIRLEEIDRYNNIGEIGYVLNQRF